MRIGCLYVDEFVPEPNTPQGKVRIEPDVSLNEPLESVLCILQKIMRVAQARDPWLRAQPDNAATVTVAWLDGMVEILVSVEFTTPNGKLSFGNR